MENSCYNHPAPLDFDHLLVSKSLKRNGNFKTAQNKSRDAEKAAFFDRLSSRPKYTRYFWEKLNEKPKKEINQANLNCYYSKLKATRPKPIKEFNLNELKMNQIPNEIFSARTKFSTKKGPKKLVQLFDETHYYDFQHTSLSANLPKSFATQRFYEYIINNHEKIPEIMKEYYFKENQTTPIEFFSSE